MGEEQQGEHHGAGAGDARRALGQGMVGSCCWLGSGHGYRLQ